jgi:hypothetical protein
MRIKLRRVVTAVVLASAVLALWPLAASAQPFPDDPLIGTWLSTVSPATGAPFSVIGTYHGDGTYIQIDGNRATALGVWVQVDGQHYTNNFHWFRFDPTTGAFSGTNTVHVDLTLDASSNTFTATYELTTRDRDGNLVLTGTGTRDGRRFH